MNFFGHSVLAHTCCPRPGFILGAMLPDFAGMARARLQPSEDHDIAAGIAFHHETDGVFHAAPPFVQMVQQVLDDLTSAGCPRGPARAAAHVGVELLLDGLLAQAGYPVHPYRAALELGQERFTDCFHGGSVSPGELFSRLSYSPLPGAYRDPERVAERLEFILRDRPRLRLRPADRPLLASVLCRHRDALGARVPSLLQYLQSRLDGLAPD